MSRQLLTASLLSLLVVGTAGCPAAPRRSSFGRGEKGCPKHCGPDSPPETRRVQRVIDGDTVVLNGGTRVRVSQINTPEIDEEFGPEARDFAKKLVLDKLVRVEGDKKDGYGRLIGDVAIGGQSLAVQLAAHGLAHLYLIPPVDQQLADRILNAQRRARKARLGIWGTARYQGLFHITSFHANPRGNDNFNLNGEYVRIASITDLPASLKGYYLQNRHGERYTYGEVVVPPGHTLMTLSGGGSDQLDAAKQLKVYWNRTRGAWSNKGDTASLHDPAGQVVDQVTYDPHHRKKY